MGLMSEDAFCCLGCSRIIVYEPYHTTGIEKCRECGTRHLVKHQKPIIMKYDETLSERVNRAKLEIEGWADWKKEFVQKFIKECT